MSTFLYILLAILIFGILIAVHEWGHFVAARLCGVKVLEFSLGMGPVLWQREGKKDTLFSLRLLPIGGFCAMEGEDGDSDDPHAFSCAPAWKRLIILAAGAAMNFLFGVVCILICFSQAEGFSAPVITDFMEGCPYESEDCLMQGDEFYSINGHRIYFTTDVTTFLARGGSDTADITVIRDGKKVTLEDCTMVPVEYIDEETGETVMKYGFYFGQIETGLGARLKYSWYQAVGFVRDVWMGLEDLITGAVGIRQMSGVVGIVDVIAEVGVGSPTVYDALLNITYLTALIAINLAVMNLLPIPALDGGRIFFLIVTWIAEHLLRRKIEPKYEAWINTAGLVLLMGLMVFIMVSDITKIITR